MTATGPVRVLETLVRHGSDLLRWRDATSAPDPDAFADMALLARPVVVTFDDPPPDLVWLHKPGRTALWRRPTQDIVPGLASAAERARPAVDETRDLFDLHGVVADPVGSFQPRRFALRAGAGAGHDLLLYPSPQGTRFGGGGGLVGSLRFDLLPEPAPAPAPAPAPGPDPFLTNPRRPVAWALIEVAVTVGVGDIRRFRAQTNANGDFRLSLWRLPPLPAGTASYAAVMSVQAELAALPSSPIDPVALTAMRLAVVPPPDPNPDPAPDPAPIAASAFADTLAIAVVPGQVQRIPDAVPRLLALRPAA
ncbi:hypothetical protein [Thiohalocapsa sp. ML1]|jgi:hypothetical protein|uniref:hypothetical protein n=1 Tax=Thiohalocapsa sp. ML1 TaxID=1431688 RepID=UPI000731FBC6|nr:hypothetical protein [Thiohalocapsa sp. ML1]